MPTNRQQLRAMTRGAYDLQALRLQAGGRLVANFKAKLGYTPGEPEEEAEAEAKARKVLDELKRSFVRLTDGVARNRTLPARNKFTGDELISDYSELVLVGQYVELERVESRQFRELGDTLNDFPIYTRFLQHVRGCGPAMSAVCISEFDPHLAQYPSSFWKYAGLDVAPDGLGRSRRREHLVKREYTDRTGATKERDSITHNPFLKTKLMGVLGVSFLRTGSPYAETYYAYKNRLQTDPNRRKATPEARAEVQARGGSWTAELWRPKRIHDASIRYMVKEFLADLHRAWRELEGLPVTEWYGEAKMRLQHSRPAHMTLQPPPSAPEAGA